LRKSKKKTYVIKKQVEVVDVDGNEILTEVHQEIEKPSLGWWLKEAFCEKDKTKRAKVREIIGAEILVILARMLSLVVLIALFPVVLRVLAVGAVFCVAVVVLGIIVVILVTVGALIRNKWKSIRKK